MAHKPSRTPKPHTISPDRVRRLAANPGTRAALPDKYLTAAQLKQRQLNARLNAPVVPGSTLTNRDVSRQATTAAQVKYGDAQQQAQQAVQQGQQLERDTQGWYDQYLKEIAQHEQNIADIGTQATGAQQALMGAMPSTVTPGLSAGNTAAANNAAAVRQAILGSFGAVTNAQGASANRYADTLAHVVAPTQKLSALAQSRGNTKTAQDALASLLKEKGSYRQQVIDQAKADESKNVLSMQALGLDQAKASASAKQAAANAAETHRHNVASEQNTRASRQAQAGKVNQYGYTDSEWRSMTTQQRQKAIRDYKRNTAAPGSGAGGYLSPEKQSAFLDEFNKAKAIVAKYHDKYSRAELAQMLGSGGRAAQTLYVDAKGNPVDSKTKGAVKVTVPAIPGVGISAALSAALDAVYDGHLSRYTIDKIHRSGYRVNQLGVSTKRPDVKKTRRIAQGGVQAVKGII